jgi:phosphoglycolate phosphatase-like HAD superfamily hydrolase
MTPEEETTADRPTMRTAGRPEVWAFDVDGCLVDLLGGTSLRPFASELLAALRAKGIRLVLWSGGGAAWALAKATQFGISPLIEGYYGKPSRDPDGRWTTSHIPPWHQPTVCVDDSPAELPRTVRSIAVRPYLAPNPGDRALLEILTRLAEDWPAL